MRGEIESWMLGEGGEGVGSAAPCSDLLGRPFYFELHLHPALVTELWVERSRKREIFDFGKGLGYQSYDLYSCSRKKKAGGMEVNFFLPFSHG